MHRPMSASRRFQRSLQRHSTYPNLPRVTSSHIWTLQPSPPPFPGPKFIASSPVCSKCATSRLKITALECGSVSAAEFGGESLSATFPKDPERILSTQMEASGDPAPSPQCSDYLFRKMPLYSSLHIG